jgi:integration host factor subunit alpha
MLYFDPHGVVLAGSIEGLKTFDKSAGHMTQSSDLTDQHIRPAIISVGRKSRTSVIRVDLIEAVYRRVGLSRAESARLVELVLKEIADCLERGEVVKLSSFGSFLVRTKGPRMGRNPKTGKMVPITPRRVMVFKPSGILKQRLASADEVIE